MSKAKMKIRCEDNDKKWIYVSVIEIARTEENEKIVKLYAKACEEQGLDDNGIKDKLSDNALTHMKMYVESYKQNKDGA